MKLIQLINQVRANVYFKSIFEINIILTTFGALVADVLSPIAPFSLAVGIILFILLMTSPIFKVVKLTNRWLTTFLGEYWSGPTRWVLFISSLMMIVTYSISSNQADNGGYLASKSETISNIQKELGIITELTKKIEDNTRRTAESTEKISSQIENVKKEVSSDPRKEVANLGLSWDVDAFSKALMSGDLKLIELFLAGGMKPTDIRNGSSVMLYGMQPALNNNPVDILTLFEKYGFDLNTHLIDSGILSHWHKSLPPYYKAENKPKDYSSYHNRFNGPLLMWITILATFQGAGESDLALINYLVDEGVERKTTISYLDFTKSWLEDTSPYIQIRPLIE